VKKHDRIIAEKKIMENEFLPSVESGKLSSDAYEAIMSLVMAAFEDGYDLGYADRELELIDSMKKWLPNGR